MEKSSKTKATKSSKTKAAVEEVIKEEACLTISLPKEKVDLKKLKNLLASKEVLIKKALNVEELSVEVVDDQVNFPWFKNEVNIDEAATYTKFISALCKYSYNAKRVNSIQKEVENEKYGFRCFLLRLGFIGKEYKQDRSILLRNLAGSAAYKTCGKEVA